MFLSLLPKASCQSQSAVVPTTSQDTPKLGLVQSLVAGRSIAAASVAQGDSCEFGSLHYFALCGLGGKFNQTFLKYNLNLVNMIILLLINTI